MGRAVILGSSKEDDIRMIKNHCDGADCVICADGGLYHAQKAGIRPYMVIGDFDSYSGKNINAEVVIKTKSEKSETDTELAVLEAIKLGHKDIILIGCIHGRLDHTIATIQLILKYRRQNIDILALSENDEVFVINSSISLMPRTGWYISFFALSEKVYGLTLDGLKYPLVDHVLQSGDALCVSNEFTCSEALIKIVKGELLVILSKKEDY